jgi:large subunit ribosomal protein L7Ae
MADESSDKIYEIIEVARTTGKIKKGVNEVTKCVEKGTAKLVVIAKDVSPAEIAMHIPLLCEEKGVKSIEVPSKEELGAAAGLEVGTVAVCITKEGEAKGLIADLG